MIGAIIGDVVGLRFEFNNIKTKEFDLINVKSQFTDDTVLTIAVMDWALHAPVKNKKTVVEYLQKWARKYPNAGYGGMFYHWKDDDDGYHQYEIEAKDYHGLDDLRQKATGKDSFTPIEDDEYPFHK
jgi:ADP-ribosylglycohydrolase